MAEKFHSSGGLSPEFALLGFLEEEPSYGYELHQRLSAELGFVWHISQSQSYAILKRLETQAYITSTKVEQEKLPARQMLKISPSGRRYFTAWLNAPTGNSVRAIRVELITRLYFTYKKNPAKVHELINEQVDVVNNNLAKLKGMLADAPDERIFNRLGLELRIQQLKSILVWLNTCRERFQ